MRTVIVPILVVVSLTLGAPRAEATPLPTDSTVPAASIIFPGGTQLVSVSYQGQGDADLLVNIDSAVYRAAGGTLDFYYQVTNNSPGPTFADIHRLAGSSFSGFNTDVWWVTNGADIRCSACPGPGFAFQNGTQAPFNVDRDTSVVRFNFPPGFEVDPAETSRVLLIRTNAISFETGFVSVTNSETITRFAFGLAGPPTTVPEPASLVAFGIGLLGTGAAMWRKRKA